MWFNWNGGGGYGQSAVKVIKEKMPFKPVKQLRTLLLFLETTQFFLIFNVNIYFLRIL